MALIINVHRVTAVLMADGWHTVQFKNGGSTFVVDNVEYTEDGNTILDYTRRCVDGR